MMNISTFINMASKIPSPGQLEGLVTFMKEDEKLRFFTESYRKTGNKSYKHDAPLFAVACIFEGGKARTTSGASHICHWSTSTTSQKNRMTAPCARSKRESATMPTPCSATLP